MDLGRSLDYLETRSDIDISKLGFYGVSLGAGVGPRLIAVDQRFKTAILASGGMYDHELPEVNVWNFLPRVRIPVLMLNGRDDFIFPVDTHQQPLFDGARHQGTGQGLSTVRWRPRQLADAPGSHQGNPGLARPAPRTGRSPRL